MLLITVIILNNNNTYYRHIRHQTLKLKITIKIILFNVYYLVNMNS